MELDAESLFNSFDQMKREEGQLSNEDALLDSWEQECEPVKDQNTKKDASSKGQYVNMLQDGSFHVCRGLSCPFLKESSDSDHALVCTLTSRIVSIPIDASHEASWTGRSCGSADPDMLSGANNAARSWKFKKDAFAESANAHRLASTISTDDVVYHGDTQQKIQIKRGAPCVNEIDESAVRENKKKKAEKRASNLQDTNTRDRLREDAVVVIRKVFAHNNVSSSSSSSSNSKPSIASDAILPTDPRLLNFKFVFSVGLQKYARSCADAIVPMNLSTIHDVAIAASKFVKRKKNEQEDQDKQKKEDSICLNYNVVQLAASLVVSIWGALCLTPYFLNHQTGDSFRPFVAGCLYGLKRGVKMKDGREVLPIAPELTDRLPTLRSQEVSQAARQLQASSHRGLCSVHRALSSIDEFMQGDEKTAILGKLDITRRLSVDLLRTIASLK